MGISKKKDYKQKEPVKPVLFSSAKGNRTPVLRMRILRPNPKTIAPQWCGKIVLILRDKNRIVF